mmetsp:Transcript_20797/g.50243  ORF Transcript_20797/g.50243 Transcript_20797/m.50243 type:complete len:366 (-) Transcript_20797:1928-3025(-)
MASSSRLQRVHFYMMLLLLSGLVFALGISRISSLRFHRFKVDLDGKKSVWYQEEKEDSIFLQLNPGTSSETAERPHQAPVFTVEKEMRTSHDFLGYLERELALSKRGPWRNGSRGHLTVRTVELNNGGNVRDWFKTHGAYVQAWMLQDASADQQYDRMYRDWGKEIFEKRRFSKNALKEIRANGRQWYRDMGDGIHNEDLHTLDAGLMGESGISSWPAVVVFRDAIIHAHGDIQTQEFMLAIAGCGSTQKNAIASNFMGPNHDIVISIAQFWGYGYYHFVHENLVRLPLLLNITAKFQQAMVQVIATNTFTMEYIQAFGVPRHRIFKGTFPHTLLESLQKLCYAPQLSSLRKRRWSSSLLTYPRR